MGDEQDTYSLKCASVPSGSLSLGISLLFIPFSASSMSATHIKVFK